MRAKKHYYKDEIKSLLIGYTLSFLFISIVLFLVFIFIYSNSIIQKNNIRANSEISKRIDEEFSYYIDFLNNQKNIDKIQYLLKNEIATKDIFTMLYALNNQTNVKSIFYVVNSKGNTIITNNYGIFPYEGVNSITSNFFRQLNKSDEIVFMNQKIQIDMSTRTIYSIGKKIVLPDGTLGYIIFDIPEHYILGEVQSKSVDMFAITDKYNNVVVSSNQLLLDEIGKLSINKSKEHEMLLMDKEYFFHKTSLLDNNLYLYTFSKVSFVYDLTKMSILFILLLVLFLTILVYIGSEYMAAQKTVAIQELLNAFERVKEGDLTARVNIKTNDEFEEIGEQFNAILDEFTNQIALNDELNERRRIAVIKQLESQFNPHFIFNTLEILKYLIHIDEAKSIELLVSFANLLRYSIDFNDKDISLKEDLDYINTYLMIQKLRYSKRLTYNISMEEGVKDCLVPKLILQPIIENCIVHGYNKKMHLNIDITIYSEDNMLIMIVEDEGDGIKAEVLQHIVQDMNSASPKSNSIGIRNVHRRLQMMYGEEYGLLIESEVDKYTKVIVRIPKML